MLSKMFNVTRNVGNIRFNKCNNWLGQLSNYNGFVEFIDQIYGIRALIILLRNYVRRGVDSPDAIIRRYAPSSENDTQSYVKFVRDYMDGFGCFDNQIDYPSISFVRLCQAICKYETGYDLTQKEYNYVETRFKL